MQAQEPTDVDGAADAGLQGRLKRIHLIAGICAVLWIVATVVCTARISDRIVASYLAQAASDAQRDAKAITRIVDHIFYELQAIAQAMANNRDVGAVVSRYSKREEGFANLPQDERAAQLKSDPLVQRVNARLTRIRDRLGYSLISALDLRGIRVAASDWDQPLPLLGVQLEDREYFHEAMVHAKGQMFAVGRTTRVPAFFFSAAVEEDDKPIGVVAVRQTNEAVGAAIAGGQNITLIVDPAGMVLASSDPDFVLRHVGPLAKTKPDAAALRDVYAQESLRALSAGRPPHPLHEAQWVVNERPYLVTRSPLTAAEYHLLVLSPLDWIDTVGPLHYVIGALAGLFGLLVILLNDRALVTRARRRHTHRLTVALNDKLKAVNAEKDRYLGIAAHDLRNPLSSIRGLAQLMVEMPLEPPQQKEFLETIHRTSDEMLGLVNDLLDVAVIESGKLDLKTSEQDVAKLVGSRIRHLEPVARAKKIELKLDTDGAHRASIDPARFGQVIDNLVSNAIKFSPPESRIDVALRSGPDNFTFSVLDQGPGISESDRKLLFRSFQKLSARPTGGEKSTGLGLAIVKRIVDAHGGTIEVESTVGSGTRFTVTAPLASAQGAPS